MLIPKCNYKINFTNYSTVEQWNVQVQNTYLSVRICQLGLEAGDLQPWSNGPLFPRLLRVKPYRSIQCVGARPTG